MTTAHHPSQVPSSQGIAVPYFRPSIGQAEIDEVADCLRSGWLTTGPRTKRFEDDFAATVGAKHAVAVNSCTAALHLAVDSLGLAPGQAVLVPTMTFAASAEVVRYQNAVPLLVDCDPVTLNMDLDDAERKIEQLRSGQTPLAPGLRIVGVIPVHVGGLMMNMDEVRAFAARHGLWVIEDAAHSFPAAYAEKGDGPDLPERREGCVQVGTAPILGAHWRRCGEDTSSVTCFSFYANKTITTGEGGMAVTDDQSLADRMRQMSLHGLSHDAWKRFAGNTPWDYRIVAPGFKYNLTDVAAAIGIHQLAQAKAMRQERQNIARWFREQLADVDQLDLPPDPPDRVHAWHLFPIRLRLDRLSIDRNTFMQKLREQGVGCSVHWRPLHLHPYYEETYGWRPEHLPEATAQWTRLISLPLFPGMRNEERQHVVGVVRELCRLMTR
jgi:dTDP-4-amino-4,6-dideoxygalactose transaminase